MADDEATTAARIGWRDVPAPVREALERRLGAAVVETASEPGGYSPSLAARCRLADGRRVFVKAVSPDQNPVSPLMLRHEIRVTRDLPRGFPAPRLLDELDDGHWVAAVFEELDAVAPRQPWDPDQLSRVLAAVDALGALADPCPVEALPTLALTHARTFSGWRTIAGDAAPFDGTAGSGPALDRWFADHLDELARIEAGWAEATAGDALVHFDLRADNVLLGRDGAVWFVDWANAATGASWVDTVLMLPSVALQGGPDPATALHATAVPERAGADAVTALVVALAGFFTHAAALPAPSGLPHLRSFQAAQGEIARAWVRERLG